MRINQGWKRRKKHSLKQHNFRRLLKGCQVILATQYLFYHELALTIYSLSLQIRIEFVKPRVWEPGSMPAGFGRIKKWRTLWRDQNVSSNILFPPFLSFCALYLAARDNYQSMAAVACSQLKSLCAYMRSLVLGLNTLMHKTSLAKWSTQMIQKNEPGVGLVFVMK